MAGDNILIAQQRDRIRYSQICSGFYAPRLFNITPGCFVYLRRDTANTAHMAARPEIYRVVELRANGVVQLDGKCGTKFMVHLAPCHLPNIDPTQDLFIRPHADLPCSVCRSPETANEMLLCDGCDKAFHLSCLKPPLEVVPEEEVWLCPRCKAAGVDPHAISNKPDPIRPSAPKVRASRNIKAGEHAATLTGRFVKIDIPNKSGRRASKSYFGKVMFRGAAYSPKFFSVTFQDGMKEIYTEKELKPMLLPATFKLPKNIVT